jgi:hypothetical protein
LDQFRFCRRKFRLSRIDGWKEKAKKASLEFGKCIEAAIQFYCDNGKKPGEAVSEFERLWLKWSDNKELVYTAQENNWFDLYTMGKEMTKLFEIQLPTLPIRNPKWQLQFLKKLWPGTDLDDLEFMAYVDLLSTLEDGSRLVLDIKTAKSALEADPVLLTMDGQLRKYAWVTGIRDVGFLNFVKAGNPNEFKKGTRVCLLEDTRDWKAGQTLTVVKFTAPKTAVEATEGVKEAPEVPWLMYLGTDETVRVMDEEQEKISGKGATEKKEQIVASFLADGRLCSVQRESVTKVRIQLVKGTIPEEEMAEIGQQIGTDMMAIREASKSNAFFMDGGTRFPNAICVWCSFNPICLRDNKKRDETLVKIGPAAKEDDWLSELEAGEEE